MAAKDVYAATGDPTVNIPTGFEGGALDFASSLFCWGIFHLTYSLKIVGPAILVALALGMAVYNRIRMKRNDAKNAPPALSTAGELLSKLTNSFLGNRFAVNFLGSETPGAVTVNTADCLTRLPLSGVCAFTFKVVSPLPVRGFTTIPFLVTSVIFFIYLFHRKSCICVHLISILKIVLFG